MDHKNRIVSTVLTAVCLWAGMSGYPLQTHAAVRADGFFTAITRCPAARNLHGDNPGNIRLTVEQVYAVTAFNKADGDYLQIKVPGAVPKKRWVKRVCGKYRYCSSAGNKVGSKGGQRIFTPFFDGWDNPVRVNFPAGKQDITPPPPLLTAFGKAVLQLCGNPGAQVDRAGFRNLLAAKKHAKILARLRKAAHCITETGRCEKKALLDFLEKIWFKSHGFKHI
ncbi:MAG: hypothetical protein GY862_18465 [Gammaproteobacteria bacterium]|nr:hypothetical protein [Gammaproteobacteria bacterium]